MSRARIKTFENTSLRDLEKDVNQWLQRLPETDEIIAITPTQSSVAVEQTHPATFGKDTYETLMRTFYSMTVYYRTHQAE